MEGTRTRVLSGILAWARDPHTKPIFWLSGIAGTGKSTIAQTVAQYCRESGILGATFFFSRGDSDRTDPSRVFTSIAFQLSKIIIDLHSKIYLAGIDTSPPEIIKSSINFSYFKIVEFTDQK